MSTIIGDSLMTKCLDIGMSDQVMNDCQEAEFHGGHGGGHGGHGGFRHGGVGFVSWWPGYNPSYCWDPIIQELRPCWEM